MTTPIRKRSPRGQGERLRRALLDAAAEVMAESGDASLVSVRAVTRRAGVSPTAMYLHFPDRDALVHAVCDEAFGELRAYLARAAGEHAGDPTAQLRAMGLAYIRFALDHPGQYRAIFATQKLRADVDAAAGEGIGKQAFMDLVAGVERARPDVADPLPTAVMLWTQLHGYVLLRATLPHFAWPDDEAIVDRLMDAYVLVR
jgi:AcrR family transcriptional regulator